MSDAPPLPDRSAIRHRLLDFGVQASLLSDDSEVVDTIMEAYEKGFQLLAFRAGHPLPAPLPAQVCTLAFFVGTLDRSLASRPRSAEN